MHNQLASFKSLVIDRMYCCSTTRKLQSTSSAFSFNNIVFDAFGPNFALASLIVSSLSFAVINPFCFSLFH